ncbi:sushi, nidogen and EGF-like domain-containing protein 1 [Dendropsophus ebraccatus]|uniref:sushi, nidogen and EGF-like domain-containing protein 1 n=1 Tax=Dendropsophus ebraccatus TaxID=150705 RepID=UPI0038315C69
MDSCAAFTVIALAASILLLETSSASAMYLYGTVNNDTVMAKADDSASPVITLPSSITLFGNVTSSIYVSTNGLLSFKTPITTFTPKDLPVVDGNPFLAPFWADINTNIAGNIYYRQSTDSTLLSQATTDIRSYFSLPSFSATWLFIATWDGVAYYGSSATSSTVNTFQAVLCSDGSLTFIMFNYGLLLWTTGTSSGGDNKGSGGTAALAGVNSGHKYGYYKLPGSLSSSIISLDSTSNVNVPGRWVIRVDTLLPRDATGIIGNVDT